MDFWTMLKNVLLITIFLLLGACVPKADQKTSCGLGETFSEKTRRCIAAVAIATPSPIQQVPVVSPSGVTYSVTPKEDTNFVATLSYSDANFDPAVACLISAPTNIYIPTGSCVCTSAGVCTVTFRGNSNYNGVASFNYAVIDNDGQSLTGTTNLIIQSVDDTPTVTAFSTSFNEDVMTNISLPYADVDGDIATSCSVSPLGFPFSNDITFPMGCNCIAGSCSAFALGDTNYNGSTSFSYTISANGSTSSSATVTVTVLPVNDAPTGSLANQTVAEDGTLTIATIPYTDPESNPASSCSVYNPVNLTVTTPCTCTGSVCSAAVAPVANLNSNNTAIFSFDYTITDSLGATSTGNTVLVNVTAVDDLPVANILAYSFNPTTSVEDTSTVVTLSYSDVDLELANACTISNVGNGTAGACTCTGSTYPNTCSFTFTPTANVNGTNIASFTYTIGTTGSTTASASVPIAFSMNAVNDAPTISAISDVNENEASTIIINNISLDEGGGVDEDSQTLTVSANSDNPTLLSNSQIALSFLESGNAANSPMSLTLTPTQGQSGVANVTITVSDNGVPALTASKTFVVTINNASFNHNGWKNLKALGPKTNTSGATLENPSVTLQWEPFTPQGTGTIAGFKIYRATVSGGQNFSQPLACDSTVNTCNDATTVSSSTDKFVDILPPNIASGTTYYYVVRPVDAATNLPTVTIESYSQIDVPIPPANMALVHRWIANKEACEKLGFSIAGGTIDANNHFRCSYAGPGNYSGYYDFGFKYNQSAILGGAGKSGHLFVDQFETGCKYSLGPTCTGSGCIGNGNPNTVGCNGSACSAANNSIFYDRSNGICYAKISTLWVPNACVPTTGSGNCDGTGKGCIGHLNGISTPAVACNGGACTAAPYSFFYDSYNNQCYYTTNGTTWTAFAPNLIPNGYSNRAHLPPLLYTSQTKASNYCVAQNKRLMTRKEFVAASAWEDNLTATNISTRESGFNLSTNNNCNTMSGSGLTYSNGALPTTGNEDTLPANLASSIRTVRTGSQVTNNCKSRYGIQDLIGNLREWNLEKYNSCYVGSDATLAKAYLKQNGILFTAKRFGTSGNRIMVRVINDPLNTGIVVNQDSNYIYLDVSLTLGTINAAQVVNLIQQKPDAMALVDVLVYNPTQVQTAYTTALSGGNNGTSSGVTGYATQATLTHTQAATYYDCDTVTWACNLRTDNETITFTSNVYGIYGNDITISFIEGSAESVVVKNGKDIEVTMNTTTQVYWLGPYYSSLESIKNLLNSNQYVSALISTNVNVRQSLQDSFLGFYETTVAPLAGTSLDGGSAPSCKASTIASPTWVNDVFDYLYGFDGMFGSGNGPGSGTQNISSWLIGDSINFNGKYFHLPLGLPSINLIDDSQEIGGDININDLHGDQIDVNTDPFNYVNSIFRYGPNRAVASGGGWYGAHDRTTNAQGITGNKAGRYSMDLLPSGSAYTYFPDLIDQYTGFRCVTEAP